MRQTVRQRIRPLGSGQKEGHRAESLSATELAFIGIGGIIGAGFFLGSGLAIRTAGPAVLLAFVLGAFITAQVTGSLTSMAINSPQEGSFKAYADAYLGQFVGFLQGWLYYLSSILTISSEAVAAAIFTQMWIPNVPLWAMAAVYALLVLLINAFGIQNFGRVESLMSTVKIAALVGFIVYAGILLFSGGVPAGVPSTGNPSHVSVFTQFRSQPFFPTGFNGLMQSMLIVVFTYAGIGVFGTAAGKAKNNQAIERGATWTVLSLAFLYITAIFLVMTLEPWSNLGTSASPFVIALQNTGMPLIVTLFNGVILVAAFSVMAGSIFSANQILVSLADEQEAPRFIRRKGPGGGQTWALAITTGAIAIALLVSNLLPENVYNFLISASSFGALFNWLVILASFLRWRRQTRQAFVSKLAFGQPISTILTMILIVTLAGYALFQHDQRLGFYAFVSISAGIVILYLLVRKRLTLKTPPSN